MTAVPDPGWVQYKSDRDRLLRRYPELTLHLFATKSGVRVHAQLLRGAGPNQPRSVETIADATWQPSEVTPEKVVDWGIRALQAWLDKRLAMLEGPPLSS